MPPRRITLVCHALLIGMLAMSVVVPPVTWLRVATAALLVTPLLIAWRGIARGDARVEQRLAVLLVAYIGGISVEVVARAGAAPMLSVALLAAVLELGMLLALIRRRRSPEARE